MGAQQSNQQVLNVFVAIVSHKALAAFVVGMMLTCRALKSTVFWLVAGPFALATPVGYVPTARAHARQECGVRCYLLACYRGGRSLYVSLSLQRHFVMSIKQSSIIVSICRVFFKCIIFVCMYFSGTGQTWGR